MALTRESEFNLFLILNVCFKSIIYVIPLRFYASFKNFLFGSINVFIYFLFSLGLHSGYRLIERLIQRNQKCILSSSLILNICSKSIIYVTPLRLNASLNTVLFAAIIVYGQGFNLNKKYVFITTLYSQSRVNTNQWNTITDQYT